MMIGCLGIITVSILYLQPNVTKQQVEAIYTDFKGLQVDKNRIFFKSDPKEDYELPLIQH